MTEPERAATPRTAARIEEGLLEAQRLLPPPPSRPRLRRYAWRDPANLLIFAVTLAAGVGRGQWWLALGAVAGEVGWLAAAPWIPAVRRRLEERDQRERAAREKERRVAALAGLSAGDRARLESLLDLRAALAPRAVAAEAPRGDVLLAALAKVDALLGLCALEARRSAELREYLEGLDPEQIERDRRRVERQAESGEPAAAEQLLQRAARARAAEAGLEASRARVAELEGALRAAASPPDSGVAPSLADLLAGVDAIAAATEPAANPGSWSRLMQRTP